MTEQIGNVILDHTWYPGSDLYSDGDVEDRLLELAGTAEEADLDAVVAREMSWPVLYHMSHLRENIVNALPVRKDETVLEVGSGCGAVTGALSAMAGEVTCIDLSRKRSLINASRHRNRDNIRIITGNFQEIAGHLEQRYDWITLIGVLEYAASYISADEPFVKFLEIIKGLLKPGGRIVIAIENRLGLKYWAGCREDHSGRLFDGLEGYLKGGAARTFSKAELEALFDRAGFPNRTFYYPYPDYKFPQELWSDSFLPGKGSLNTNICNFDRDRVVLFDEGAVFDTLASDGQFPAFSNSFLVILGERAEEDRLIYARFSDERDRRFAVHTLIRENEQDAGRTVVKKNVYAEGKAHLENMKNLAPELEKLLERAGIKLCPLADTPEGLAFPYITHSESLGGYLRTLWQQGKQEESAAILRSYCGRLQNLADVKFTPSAGFTALFGASDWPEGTKSMPVTDLDLIPDNILLPEGIAGSWVHIDCEWVYDFHIPVQYVIYRIWHYFLAGCGLKEDDARQIGKWTDLDEKELEKCRRMEKAWQDMLTGTLVPVRELHGSMTPGVKDLRPDLRPEDAAGRELSCSIWYGSTEGEYPGEYRMNYKTDSEGVFSLTVPLKLLGNPAAVRFDPVEGSLCRLCSVRSCGEKNRYEMSALNGFASEEGDEFWTLDPAYVIRGDLSAEDTLTITGKITLLDMKACLGKMEKARIDLEDARLEAAHLRSILEKDPLYRIGRKAKKLLRGTKNDAS